MAADIFAKLGDIKGESLDSKHKDEIEVLSYSWGVTNSGSMAFGTGGGDGKSVINDIHFEHLIDKASPVLIQTCATGAHLKDATITHRKAGKEQQEFIIIKLTDVIVTGVTHSNGASGPSESVSLSFSKVHLDYKPQKADGTLDAAITFKYDLKAQKEF